jgi:protein subunit release factor A
VHCSVERSQLKNREKAMAILVAKLEQLNDEVAIYFVDMKSGNTTV